MPKFTSLTDYATKRFRLAGKAVLDNGNPFFAATDKLQAETEAHGHPFISFANYDYLGLATHPQVKQAASAALEQLGVGALASRLVGGERSSHQAFESELAAFLGVESTLSLVSGYLTNLTTISHLMGARDAVFIDELSHNSVVSGAKSSGAEVVTFRHNDVEHLDQLLQARRCDFRNVMIVVEGLYSMDGDIADLRSLVEVKERHGAWLLVDEAHSLGVLGASGRGLCEYAGVDPARVDLIIGTLSKTLASCGGFVAGKSAIIDWMRFTLPGFVYSVGLSPVITAAASTALSLMQTESWRIERLRQNAELFVSLCRQFGLETGPAIGRGVVPVIFNDSLQTLGASRHLMDNGFYVPPIIQIGVPKDLPRLRFFLSASHTEDNIRDVIGLLAAQPQVQTPALQQMSAAP